MPRSSFPIVLLAASLYACPAESTAAPTGPPRSSMPVVATRVQAPDVEARTETPACAPDGVDYGAVLEDGTPLRADAGAGPVLATLSARQFLCLQGPATSDAAGVWWQPVTAIPTVLEPACSTRAGDCPPPPPGADSLLAACRIGARRYTPGCPTGWVRVDAIEDFPMGLGGRWAEPAGVDAIGEASGSSGSATQETLYAVAGNAGHRCEALARVGTDGWGQVPVLRLEVDGATPRTVELGVPSGRYQARATHCIIDGDAVLVLVQADSDPSAALNQTLLRVERIAIGDGRVLASADLHLAAGKRSQWVTTSDGFALHDGALVVRGLERGERDDTADQAFTAGFDPVSLAPREK